jgi:hypothetical protein
MFIFAILLFIQSSLITLVLVLFHNDQTMYTGIRNLSVFAFMDSTLLLLDVTPITPQLYVNMKIAVNILSSCCLLVGWTLIVAKGMRTSAPSSMSITYMTAPRSTIEIPSELMTNSLADEFSGIVKLSGWMSRWRPYELVCDKSTKRVILIDPNDVVRKFSVALNSKSDLLERIKDSIMAN